MKNNKGFTLIELMVVLVIIGILATMAIPKFMSAANKAKATECKPVLKEIYTLQAAYYIEQDLYASSADLLGFTEPSGEPRFIYGILDGTGGDGTVGTATIGEDLQPAKKDDIACIDSLSSIRATGGLPGLLNVDLSTCK